MPIPQNYSAPVKLSAKDRAYNQIQEWIVDGTLVPNEKINDAQLANALGISRTPVREALQLLALQGLVAMKPGVHMLQSLKMVPWERYCHRLVCYRHLPHRQRLIWQMKRT